MLSGIPQGTVLAPLLFLIYINDLPLHVSSKVRLYADDAILYSNIYSVEDCHQLDRDLDSLTQWAHKWLMTFNPIKSEFLRITNKINIIPSIFINALPQLNVIFTKQWFTLLWSMLPQSETHTHTHVLTLIN